VSCGVVWLFGFAYSLYRFVLLWCVICGVRVADDSVCLVGVVLFVMCFAVWWLFIVHVA